MVARIVVGDVNKGSLQGDWGGTISVALAGELITQQTDCLTYSPSHASEGSIQWPYLLSDWPVNSWLYCYTTPKSLAAVLSNTNNTGLLTCTPCFMTSVH